MITRNTEFNLKNKLIVLLFEALIRDGRTPECRRFRADNHQHLALIEKMEREQVLKIKDGRYEIPIEQLTKTSHWPREGRIANKVLHKLRELYLDDVNALRPVSLLMPKDEPHLIAGDIQRAIGYLHNLGFIGGLVPDKESGEIQQVYLTEEVLKYQSIEEKIKANERWRKRSLQARTLFTLRGTPGLRRFSPPTPSHRDDAKDISRFHAKLLLACQKQYQDGHYREAILNAFTSVFDYIRERSGQDLDGTSLINKVFSIEKPILRVNALSTQSEKNEQIGLMEMLRGAYTGIRNPKAHSLKFQQKSPENTFEYLAFASLLMRLIEKSKLTRKRGSLAAEAPKPV